MDSSAASATNQGTLSLVVFLVVVHRFFPSVVTPAALGRWARSHRVQMTVARRLLGAVALLAGIAIGAWFIYNLFSPAPEFKGGFRSVFQFIIPIACIVVGWKWLRYEGKGVEEMTPPNLTCPELERSIVAAKESMPYFLEQVNKNVDGAYIKFPLTTPNGLTEHIWAYVHSFRDGRFNVTLANTPYDAKQSSEGRRDVPKADVEDWQIMHPDGRIKGAHSLIALFRYHENRGVKLTPKMMKQKAQLVDAT